MPNNSQRDKDRSHDQKPNPNQSQSLRPGQSGTAMPRNKQDDRHPTSADGKHSQTAKRDVQR